jgi:hypothetical protein
MERRPRTIAVYLTFRYAFWLIYEFSFEEIEFWYRLDHELSITKILLQNELSKASNIIKILSVNLLLSRLLQTSSVMFCLFWKTKQNWLG